MLSLCERDGLHGGEQSEPEPPGELSTGGTSAGNSHAWQSGPGFPDNSDSDYTDLDLQIVSDLPHISCGLRHT